MLERLADVQARSHKLGSLVPEHLEEFHGQVELLDVHPQRQPGHCLDPSYLVTLQRRLRANLR